jgi:hypothetical protein
VTTRLGQVDIENSTENNVGRQRVMRDHVRHEEYPCRLVLADSLPHRGIIDAAIDAQALGTALRLFSKVLQEIGDARL